MTRAAVKCLLILSLSPSTSRIITLVSRGINFFVGLAWVVNVRYTVGSITTARELVEFSRFDLVSR